MGVLDKDSGQMDVYNAEIFNMQPLLSGRRVLCLTPVPGCGVLDLSVPSAISCLVPDDSALLSPGCSLFLISAFFPQLRGRRIRYIFPYKAPHDVKNREGSFGEMLGGGEAESVRGGRVEVLDSVTKLSLLRVSAALSSVLC